MIDEHVQGEYMGGPLCGGTFPLPLGPKPWERLATHPDARWPDLLRYRKTRDFSPSGDLIYVYAGPDREVSA